MKSVDFVELFCGVGGFRLGLEKAKMEKRISTFTRTRSLRRGCDALHKECSSPFTCVWANDNDKYACKIYRKNFGSKELVEADIKTVNANTIPDHTLLTAGFPCQAFSVAGKRKGFEDTRGTLFYDIARIVKAKRPKVLLLENVKGLLSAKAITENGTPIEGSGGYVFARILATLEGLGYLVEWQVLNSKYFGVPQNRERVFIIGHLRGKGSRQIFPIAESGCELVEVAKRKQTVATVDASYYKGYDHKRQLLIHNVYGGFKEGLRTFQEHAPTIRTPKGGGHLPMVVEKSEKHCPTCICDETDMVINPNPEETDDHCETCTCHNPTFNAIINRWKKHKDKYWLRKKGNKLDLPLNNERVCALAQRTAQGSAWRKDVPTLDQTGSIGIRENAKIRRLTPTECERLQGFPDGWTEGISDTQRYKCLGNAVTVNVIEYLGKLLLAS